MSLHTQGMIIADLERSDLDDVCSLEHRVNRQLSLSRKVTRAALDSVNKPPCVCNHRVTWFGGAIAHPSNPATLQRLGPADAYAYWMIQAEVLHIHRVAVTDAATARHFDAKFVELLVTKCAGPLPVTCWTTAEQGPKVFPYTPPADLLEGLGFQRLFQIDQAFEHHAGQFWWNPQETGLTAKLARQQFRRLVKRSP